MTSRAHRDFPERTAFLPVRSMVVSRTAEYRDDESWRPSASHGKAAGPGYFPLRPAGDDVRTHGMTAFMWCRGIAGRARDPTCC
jgi:hypothetical protein